MNMAEFEGDRRLDPNELDVACIEQADLFFKWAERAVAVRVQIERLRHDLETYENNLSIRVRDNPQGFGLKKDTEGAINAVVEADPTVLTMKDQLIQLRGEQGLLDQAVVTMDMRKRMIENLITLHGQQYFAGPSVPRDLVAAWAEHQSKVETTVRDRQAGVARKRVKMGGV